MWVSRKTFRSLSQRSSVRRPAKVIGSQIRASRTKDLCRNVTRGELARYLEGRNGALRLLTLDSDFRGYLLEIVDERLHLRLGHGEGISSCWLLPKDIMMVNNEVVANVLLLFLR